MTPEHIKALVPIYLITIGAIIALATIFMAAEDKASGFGLASTAIAGGAGLADPNTFNTNKKDPPSF